MTFTLPFPHALYSNTEQVVANSAAAMDVIRPDWYNEVDLALFSISSSSRCIIGQTFGNYYTEIYKEREALGGRTLADDVFCFAGGQREWERVIRSRREQNNTAEGRLRKAVAELRAEGHEVNVTIKKTVVETVTI